MRNAREVIQADLEYISNNLTDELTYLSKESSHHRGSGISRLLSRANCIALERKGGKRPTDSIHGI